MIEGCGFYTVGCCGFIALAFFISRNGQMLVPIGFELNYCRVRNFDARVDEITWRMMENDIDTALSLYHQ